MVLLALTRSPGVTVGSENRFPAPAPGVLSQRGLRSPGPTSLLPAVRRVPRAGAVGVGGSPDPMGWLEASEDPETPEDRGAGRVRRLWVPGSGVAAGGR